MSPTLCSQVIANGLSWGGRYSKVFRMLPVPHASICWVDWESDRTRSKTKRYAQPKSTPRWCGRVTYARPPTGRSGGGTNRMYRSSGCAFTGVRNLLLLPPLLMLLPLLHNISRCKG